MFNLNKSIRLPSDFVLAFQTSRPELYPKRALNEEESKAVSEALQVFHETLVDALNKQEMLQNLLNQLLAASEQTISSLYGIRNELVTEFQAVKEELHDSDED